MEACPSLAPSWSMVAIPRSEPRPRGWSQYTGVSQRSRSPVRRPERYKSLHFSGSVLGRPCTGIPDISARTVGTLCCTVQVPDQIMIPDLCTQLLLNRLYQSRSWHAGCKEGTAPAKLVARTPSEPLAPCWPSHSSGPLA